MRKNNNLIKFIIYALFGSFMFFIPITIGDRNTIPVDHIVKWILSIPYVVPVVGGSMILFGSVLPFIKGDWKNGMFKFIMSILGICGAIFTVMVLLKTGPDLIIQENMAPYVFKAVVVPVIVIVPIGSVFLAFLIDYGLMEFIGVFARPFMNKIFKVPGRAAVDAVSSFVGSYSIALLITNQAYIDGKYTKREAAIIATGFSTVSATFMIITANTLGIMEHWLLFFFICLIVTFIVTALTVRLYPLNKFSDSYYEGAEPDVELEIRGNYIRRAFKEGIEVFEKAAPISKNIIKNFKAGLKLGLEIGPNIMSIGVISLLVANYTKVFDILGYIFYPLIKILQIPEPMLAAKGVAVSLADMYVPAIINANSGLVNRFTIGVLCISEILFFSASIPCIMATKIPLKIKDIFVIWLWRVILTLILTAPIAHLLF
ncbi:YjiH family protein [Peptoniphilus sp. AGMB00490]|uniref:YjiH family protein n=1 Tax=Peptoniphilus faecalis TaxID=2731255 RepID=A0A848RNF5_9FIRM|nr:YjiH family protein [Peptoniphilus faecalis]NMW85674.1 YjiH family protein [Peptoniphilus faecalis]